MIERKAVCLAYETVEKTDRSLPLLVPMSEVAGRMAIQEGAKYLEKPMGGRGILLGGVAGVKPANVLVLGGGIVGTQAAKMAAGLGANVTIMDVSLPRLRYLEDVMPANVDTVMSNEYNIREAIKLSDLIVGAVLIPGAKAPHLITRDMLKLMRPGTVVVDVADALVLGLAGRDREPVVARALELESGGVEAELRVAARHVIAGLVPRHEPKVRAPAQGRIGYVRTGRRQDRPAARHEASGRVVHGDQRRCRQGRVEPVRSEFGDELIDADRQA